jgi:hypothetical protein
LNRHKFRNWDIPKEKQQEFNILKRLEGRHVPINRGMIISTTIATYSFDVHLSLKVYIHVVVLSLYAWKFHNQTYF